MLERVRELIDWLKRPGRATLKDVAYTLNRVEQRQGGARLGIVASSLSDLTERLTAVSPKLSDPACRTIRDARGVYFWEEPLYQAGAKGLAFLFPGEGSQYPGMLADLCIHFPEVRRSSTRPTVSPATWATRFRRASTCSRPRTERDEKLWSTATAVNVVLNAQWAMYQVLTRLGLRPDAVVGHSSGELLALAAAGVFPTDRALEQKLGRLGSIFRGFESSGDLPAARLVAVAADRERVEAICRAAVRATRPSRWTIALTRSSWPSRRSNSSTLSPGSARRTSSLRNSRFRVPITRRASPRSSARSPISSRA